MRRKRNPNARIWFPCHNPHARCSAPCRTMATRLGALGVLDDIVGRILNHARHSVTARHYNLHDYLPEKRAALEAWGKEVMRLVF
jgi:hypothetical protein